METKQFDWTVEGMSKENQRQRGEGKMSQKQEK